MTTEENTPTIEDQASIVFGEKHLRRRPFLIVYELYRPARGVKTEVKGWKEKPGQLQAFERPMIVDYVSAKQMTEAALIIDLLNRSIVKNRYATVETGEPVVARYMEKYAEHITEGLRRWAQRSALNIGQKAAA